MMKEASARSARACIMLATALFSLLIMPLLAIPAFSQEAEYATVHHNHFYGGGVLDISPAPKGSTFCVGGEGNFYQYQIPWSNIGWNDCGPLRISSPEWGFTTFGDSVDVTWSRQSSIRPLRYDLEYSSDNGATWSPMATFENPALLSYTWPLSPIPSGTYLIRAMPFDGVAYGTINFTKMTINRFGDVSGTTSCRETETGELEPVGDARVCIGDGCTYSDSGSDYYLEDVLMGEQTIIASKPLMKSQRMLIDVVPQGEITDINFDDICPIIVDCNPDCTVKGTEEEAYPVCDPRCDGVNDCVLDPHCEYASKGSIASYVEKIDSEDVKFNLECCIGDPEASPAGETKSNIEVDADNIAKTTRIVYYKGKPVKMVVVTWS